MAPTIYTQLKPAAERHLSDYRDDFFRHDQRTCRKMERGETWVWVCRETGTHLHRVNAPESAGLTREDLALSWDLLDALRDMGPAVKAVAICEITDTGRGTVTWLDAVPARPKAMEGVHNKRPFFA